MSGNTIGEVNINLRLSLAQFKKDTQNGTAEASRATKQMADEMKTNTMEARGTLMLMGEEIGVHIPRHLQRMIAELPGVGTALSAAFSSVAVLALIEIVAKVVEKVQKWREEAAKVAEEWRKLGVETEKESASLRVANDQLENTLAKLRGATPNTVKLLLDESYKAALELAEALDKDAKKMDELMKKNSIGLFSKMFMDQAGSDDIQAAVTQVHERIKEITDEQAKQLSVVKTTAEADKIRAESAVKIKEAYAQANTQLATMLHTSQELQGKHDSLASMPSAVGSGGAPVFQSGTRDQSERIKTLTTATKELAREAANASLSEQQLGLEMQVGIAKGADDARKALEAAQKAVDGMRGSVQSLIQKFEEKTETPYEKTAHDADLAERKIREMAADNPKLFKQAFPNDSVDTLVASMRRFAAQAEDRELLASLKEINKELNTLPNKMPDLPTAHAQPVLAADAHVPTSAAAELQKIQRDEKAAGDEARKVIDSIQTQNQKFHEQVAILDELKAKGLLTGQEYQLAMKKAQDAADKVTGSWKKLGGEISNNIADALTFAKSWQDALKSVLNDIVKVIMQLAVMNAMKNAGSASGSGGGGFLGMIGSLFGGHRAGGGSVDAGRAYVVGEKRPELFVPDTAGTIIPSLKSASGGGQPQSVTYQHVVNVTTPDADSFRKSKAQISADSYDQMATAHARNR